MLATLIHMIARMTSAATATPNTTSTTIQRIYDGWLFASEAEIVGLAGLAMIGVALIALFAEKRRNRVARIDRIGWVPWTPIFLASAMIAAALIALAFKGIMAGE